MAINDVTLKRVTNADGTADIIHPSTNMNQIVVSKSDSTTLTTYLSNTYIPLTQKGANSGVATLDSLGKLTYSQLPDAVFGGLKYGGTITGSGSPATYTLNDNLAPTGVDPQYFWTQGGDFSESYVGYYWIATQNVLLADTETNNPVKVFIENSGTAVALDNTPTTGTVARMNAGDWLVFSGVDLGGESDATVTYYFSIVNNTYDNATTTDFGVVILNSATAVSDLDENASAVVSGEQLKGLVVADASSLSSTTNLDKIAPAAHHHDGLYYTETEVQNFFSGSTAISGYNKTNWDAAYTHSQTAHAPSNAITASGVTYENLAANGDVGTGATQVAAGNHNHDATYQALDADLTAIAGLATNSGLLRKTAANTWSLDTNTYLTSASLTGYATETWVANYTDPLKYAATIPTSGNIVGTIYITED